MNLLSGSVQLFQNLGPLTSHPSSVSYAPLFTLVLLSTHLEPIFPASSHFSASVCVNTLTCPLTLRLMTAHFVIDT